MKKKSKLAITIAACCIIMYIILHSTPSMAIRTYLFVNGNSNIAFTAKIFYARVDKQLSLANPNAKWYIVSPTPSPYGKKSYISVIFKVTKKGFLNFA